MELWFGLHIADIADLAINAAILSAVRPHNHDKHAQFPRCINDQMQYFAVTSNEGKDSRLAIRPAGGVKVRQCCQN